MRLEEIISIISEKFDKPINQSILATCLNVTRQTISNRIKNNSEVTVSELNKIERFFDITILDTSLIRMSENIVVDYYPDVFASCGNGTVIFSEEKELIKVPKAMLNNYSSNKRYSMINAKGDSMSPYINDTDKLIVEHTDCEQIVDNKIYAFCYKEDFLVKRLAKNVDEVIIKSDNTAYSTKIIKNDNLNELYIIGKVVGIIRNI